MSRKAVVVQIVVLFLAVGLFYLALRGVDFSEFVRGVREAHWGWFVPLVAIAFFSHLIRAIRWNILIRALPEAGERLPSVWESFGAIMTGYMINYGAPRLGEFARAGIVSRRTKFSFSGVFGTVVADRVLDVGALGLALVSVLLLLRARLTNWLRLAFANVDFGGGTAVVVAVLAALVVLGAVLAHRRFTAINQDGGRISGAITAFVNGLKSLLTTPKKITVLALTVAMWACYLLMAFIPLHMFDIDQTYGLGLADTWSIMNLGALGVVIPTPGGVGSYHYITVQVLNGLYGVHPAPAATYAVITHGFQLLVYTVAGLISLVALGYGLSGILRAARETGNSRRSS